MTNPHPLEQEIRVWAADPETWVFRHKYEDHVNHFPPPAHAAHMYQCVPEAWLDDPDSVDVWARFRNNPVEGNDWFFVDPKLKLHSYKWQVHKDYEYDIRLKPKQVTIPERRIPVPMRNTLPERGTDVWVASPGHPDWAYLIAFDGCVEMNVENLARGICYTSRDDAIAAAKAMIPGADHDQG